MLQKLRFFIIIIILLLLYLPGFAKFQELKQKLADTQRQITVTKKRNAQLEKTINQMKNDKDYLERVAREKMGVVKKGEMVVRIIEEPVESVNGL